MWGFWLSVFFPAWIFLRFLQDWICWVGNFFAMGWKSQFFTTIWENMFFACAPLGQSTKSIISAVAGVWWQVLLDKSWTPWSRWEWRRSYGSISRILWSMLIEYCFGQSGIPRQQGMSKLFSKLHTEVPLPRVPLPKTPSIVLLPKAPFAKAPGVLMPPPKAPGIDIRGDTSSEEEGARPTRDPWGVKAPNCIFPAPVHQQKKSVAAPMCHTRPTRSWKASCEWPSVSSSTLTLGRLFPNTVSSECTRAQRQRC